MAKPKNKFEEYIEKTKPKSFIFEVTMNDGVKHTPRGHSAQISYNHHYLEIYDDRNEMVACFSDWKFFFRLPEERI